MRMPLCRVKLRSSSRNLNLPLLGKPLIELHKAEHGHKGIVPDEDR